MLNMSYKKQYTVEPECNEPVLNEILHITIQLVWSVPKSYTL